MNIKIGILAACFVMMSLLAISPCIASISAQFPDVSISKIQMLVTLPQLMSVPFSLLVGRLTVYFTKKNLAMLSMACIVIGAEIPPMYSHNINVLLGSSCMIGAGLGGLMTLTSALICEYFVGADRSRMMGLQAAVINCGGMVFSILGGKLAGYGWEYAYRAFLLVIPALLLLMVLLPKGRIEERTNPVSRGKIGLHVFHISLIVFLFNLFVNVYNTNISLYVAQRSLGGAFEASVATACVTLGGILAGISMKQVMNILGKYILVSALFLTAIGCTVVFFGDSLLLVCIAGFMIGFGSITFFPAASFFISQTLSARSLAMGMAIFFSFGNLGGFLSPIVVNAISDKLAVGVQGKFLLAAGSILLITVLTFSYKLSNQE